MSAAFAAVAAYFSAIHASLVAELVNPTDNPRRRSLPPCPRGQGKRFVGIPNLAARFSYAGTAGCSLFLAFLAAGGLPARTTSIFRCYFQGSSDRRELVPALAKS